MCHSTRVVYSVCAHHVIQVTHPCNAAVTFQTTANGHARRLVRQCRITATPQHPRHPESNTQVVMGWCQMCSQYFQSLNLCFEPVILNLWKLRAGLRMGGPINPATLDLKILFCGPDVHIEERAPGLPTWEEQAIAKALGIWNNPRLTSMECNNKVICDECIKATLNGTHIRIWIKGMRTATLEWAVSGNSDPEHFRAEEAKSKTLAYHYDHPDGKRHKIKIDERQRTLKAQLEVFEHARKNEEHQWNRRRKNRPSDDMMPPAKRQRSTRNGVNAKEGPITPPFCKSRFEEALVNDWHKSLEAFGYAGPRPTSSQVGKFEELTSPTSLFPKTCVTVPQITGAVAPPKVYPPETSDSASASTNARLAKSASGLTTKANLGRSRKKVPLPIVIDEDEAVRPKPTWFDKLQRSPAEKVRQMRKKAGPNQGPSTRRGPGKVGRPRVLVETDLQGASTSPEPWMQNFRRKSIQGYLPSPHRTGKLRPPPKISRSHIKCSLHGKWSQTGCPDCFRRIIDEKTIPPGRNCVSLPSSPVGGRGEYVDGVQALCFCHIGGVKGCLTCSVREESRMGGLTWF